MLKKTITFEDLDGNEVTDDFYFNLTVAELTELEVTHKGGFESYMKAIIEAEDGAAIIKIIKDVIWMSYGVKHEDGRRFIKSDELSREFSQTDAYSTLFMELSVDDVKAAEFMNAVVPNKLSQMLDKMPTPTPVQMGFPPVSPEEVAQVAIIEAEKPAAKKPIEMTREELIAAMQERNAQ